MSTGGSEFTPAHLHEYLVAARAKLLDWVRPLSLSQYTQEFPFGLKTLRSTMLEIAGGEWAYTQRLRGEEIPPPPDRPYARFADAEFAPLEAAWKEQAERTARTLHEVSDWGKAVEYTARPPDRAPIRIQTTTGGIAAQLLFHEIHHRAQAMAMLRQLGIPAQDLDYSILMFRRTDLPA